MRILSLTTLLFVTTVAAAGVPPVKAPVAEMVEGITCASDPSQTYTLYLPKAFDGSKRWPVLMIFDPRGRSVLAAELFREAADANGWILVSSDNTRSDGPMEPNVEALRALWPEVHTRLPSRPDRIYATGLSGGAAVAYVLSRSTREVAGIIACGGRFLPDELEGNDVPLFSIAGSTDFNYHEMHQVDEFLAEQGNRHRLAIFDGPHTWMPQSLAQEAVEWFELVAMSSGLGERNAQRAASLYAADLERAGRAEDEGRLIEAARRYREMLATYDGMHGLDEAKDALNRLEESSELRKQQKELKKWNAFERSLLEEMNRHFFSLRNDEVPPPPARLARSFRISELERRARKPGFEGVTAQRVLNTLATGLNFYVARDLTAAGQYDRLAVCLEVGLMIQEENPVGWYNLACARARMGHAESAIEALEKALVHGFARYELMASDPDLDSLREREDFKAMLREH